MRATPTPRIGLSNQCIMPPVKVAVYSVSPSIGVERRHDIIRHYSSSKEDKGDLTLKICSELDKEATGRMVPRISAHEQNIAGGSLEQVTAFTAQSSSSGDLINPARYRATIPAGIGQQSQPGLQILRLNYISSHRRRVETFSRHQTMASFHEGLLTMRVCLP